MNFHLRSDFALLYYASVSIGELLGDERGETFTSACTLAPLGAPRGFLKFTWQTLPFVKMEDCKIILLYC